VAIFFPKVVKNGCKCIGQYVVQEMLQGSVGAKENPDRSVFVRFTNKLVAGSLLDLVATLD